MSTTRFDDKDNKLDTDPRLSVQKNVLMTGLKNVDHYGSSEGKEIKQLQDGTWKKLSSAHPRVLLPGSNAKVAVKIPICIGYSKPISFDDINADIVNIQSKENFSYVLYLRPRDVNSVKEHWEKPLEQWMILNPDEPLTNLIKEWQKNEIKLLEKTAPEFNKSEELLSSIVEWEIKHPDVSLRNNVETSPIQICFEWRKTNTWKKAHQDLMEYISGDKKTTCEKLLNQDVAKFRSKHLDFNEEECRKHILQEVADVMSWMLLADDTPTVEMYAVILYANQLFEMMRSVMTSEAKLTKRKKDSIYHCAPQYITILSNLDENSNVTDLTSDPTPAQCNEDIVDVNPVISELHRITENLLIGGRVPPAQVGLFFASVAGACLDNKKRDINKKDTYAYLNDKMNGEERPVSSQTNASQMHKNGHLRPASNNNQQPRPKSVDSFTRNIKLPFFENNTTNSKPGNDAVVQAEVPKRALSPTKTTKAG